VVKPRAFAKVNPTKAPAAENASITADNTADLSAFPNIFDTVSRLRFTQLVMNGYLREEKSQSQRRIDDLFRREHKILQVMSWLGNILNGDSGTYDGNIDKEI
jgi:hypothetical protein